MVLPVLSAGDSPGCERGVFMREIEELSQYLADEKVRGLRKALGKDIQEKLSKSGILFSYIFQTEIRRLYLA